MFSSLLIIIKGTKGEKGTSGSKVGPPEAQHCVDIASCSTIFIGVIVLQDDISHSYDLQGDRGMDGLSVPGPPGPPGLPGPVINLQDVSTCNAMQYNEKIKIKCCLWHFFT